MNRAIRGLDSTVAQAQMTMNQLNSKNGSLGKLMNDDSLYRNLNGSSESLNALLMDLKANPKRYVHFSLLQIGGGGKADKEAKEAAEKAKNAPTVQNVQGGSQ
jgi:phospholipid/cholesterol/gamma-HCH transport system substrate-binding protein